MRIRLAANVAAVVACACLDPLGSTAKLPAGASLAIREENLRSGSTAWDVADDASDSTISGYVLPISLQQEDTLHIFVTAKRPPLSIAIYRLGWYNNAGGRLVSKHADVHASDQIACSPPVPGPSVCTWSETDRLVIGPEWVPGVYLARFTDSIGRTSAFPFVVRSDRVAAFAVVLSFATYEAYNQMGGASLYGGPGATQQESYANRAVKVSFARPLNAWVVQNDFLGVDYMLVRWLEQNAYDVNYITDYDFHLGGGVDPKSAWLFAGHSEYWTWPMWLRANAARDQGINLGFLGGNDIYWVSRFETVPVNGLDAPVLVCYRDATRDPQGSTPGLATVLFRSPPNNAPENSLVGVMSSFPELVRGSPIDLVVADGSDPLMAGTGLTTGEHIPRVAGWEADRIVDNGLTPPGIRTLFESPYVSAQDTGTTGVMQSTVYRWPASGALVFASGEPGFAWGLETFRDRVARPPLERLLQNVLQAFIANRP
jgi:hypothetical protein